MAELNIKTVTGGPLDVNTYVVGLEDGDSCVLVDPGAEVFRVEEAVAGRRVEAVLLTHGHFDHMLSLADWRAKTGAPIAVTREDAPALTDPDLNGNRLFFGTDTVYPAADLLLSEGQEILFGNERLTVMKTPGHTRGSCVYLGNGVIFTGDTMMSDGAYGRYDLPGGSASALRESLFRLATLDGDYTLYPGHGRESTLNEEKIYYIR